MFTVLIHVLVLPAPLSLMWKYRVKTTLCTSLTKTVIMHRNGEQCVLVWCRVCRWVHLSLLWWHEQLIHVGLLAVSRYHQICCFFLVENHLLYSDLDFLFRNLKITLSECVMLKKLTTRNRTDQRVCHLCSRSFTRTTHRASLHSEESRQSRTCRYFPPRSQNISDDFKIDKLHHQRRRVPKTEPVHVLNNRSAKFHQATSVCHTNETAF